MISMKPDIRARLGKADAIKSQTLKEDNDTLK